MGSFRLYWPSIVIGQIHQGVDYSIFEQIASAKTTKETWDMFKMSYKEVDQAQKSKLQLLRRLYDRCKLTTTETVEQYFSHLIDIIYNMRLNEEKITHSTVVKKVLRTLPRKYDHVVASIIESHDTEFLSVVELKSMIESHINQIAAKTEIPIEEALKFQINLDSNDYSNMEGLNRDHERERGNFWGRGHGNNTSHNRERGNNQDKFLFIVIIVPSMDT
ncbi:uncharacterized protein LOC127257596 [Andrographis paniculata]|uniref:uncharacterized protein LOC127257596 n=1 Tax=Andrographis paniculata TaxID=175694 RepID=UPI0021E936F7|nr:uncharacterized protein LOC127257596 [Andrographis paniculata]